MSSKKPARKRGGAQPSMGRSGFISNPNDARNWPLAMRWRMVEWSVADSLPYSDIAKRLSTSTRRLWPQTVGKVVKLFLSHDHVGVFSKWKPRSGTDLAELRDLGLGGHGSFSAAEMLVVKTALEQQPDMFVTTELTDVMRALTGRHSLHSSTVWRAVRALNLTRKKIEHNAFQRDEHQRAEWRALVELHVQMYGHHRDWFFLDESGFGAFIHRRTYGYAKRGMPAILKEPFYNCGNMSMLSCVGLAGIVLQHFVRGAFDADLFLSFMRELVLQLPVDSMLVMDNCRIHHTHIKMLRELFALKNIAILFLPPYSPDMNPIEKFFGSVKAELRGKNKNNYTNLDALFHQDEAGPMKLDLACGLIPLEHFAAWFRNCGYTL